MLSKKLKAKLSKRIASMLSVIMVCIVFFACANIIAPNVFKETKEAEELTFVQTREESKVNIELPDFDEYIYIDAIEGDDTTGDGTPSAPYKTLEKITQSGIITQGNSYCIVLYSGTYNFTQAMCNLNCNKSINIIGNKANTIVKVSSLFANSGGGTNAYSINFYRLVWNGTSAPANAVFVRNSMNFYNVVFQMDFSAASYSYFIPSSTTVDMVNCTLPKQVTSFIRTTQNATVRLINCYGGFTSGYGTNDAKWNYQTNRITSTPQTNSAYEITEDESVWKDVGTGTDADGSQADLGVYGGTYDWDAGIEGIDTPRYVIKERRYKLAVNETAQIEIIDKNGLVDDPDETNWTWSSSDSSITTVNSRGVVRKIADGAVTITATSKENGKAITTIVFNNTNPTCHQIGVDEEIFIDAVNGNDTTGDGTKNNPYKTLNKITASGIITQGSSYGIVLAPGTYDFTTGICTLDCNKSIHIIGSEKDTIVNMPALWANSGGGSNLYSINFYKLIWNATSNSTNTIFIRNPMNLYNVVLKYNFTASSISYFIPASSYNLYNCVMPQYVTGLIRTTEGSVLLTNCYGGFTSGYGTNDARWNYQTNYITSTPKVNSENYLIEEDESIWKNTGTGTDKDGSKADLGVYGGSFGWGPVVVYKTNVRNSFIKVDETVDLNVENVYSDVEVDQSIFTWSSSNTEIATVSSTGKVTGKGAGTATITGVDNEGKKVRAIVNVVRNVNNAITVPDVRIGTQNDGYTVVLKEDGTVWATGLNGSGQLGQGNTTNTNRLVQVKTDSDTYLRNIIKIDVGYHAVIALTADGEVYTWGNNENGKLGLGDSANRMYATKVPDLENIIDISTARYNSFALDINGNLYATGKTGNSILGRAASTTFTKLAGPSNAMCVKSDWEMVGVMTADGKSCSWGDTSTVNSLGTDIVTLEIGGGGTGYVVAVKEDKTIWGYGNNGWGWFGTGGTTNLAGLTKLNYSSGEEVKVKLLKNSVCHLVFKNTDNKLYAAGYNPKGQLSNGTTTERIATYTEMKYSDGSSVTDALNISCGDGHDATGIIKTNGEVWISGNNANGELGNGTNTNSSYFTQAGDRYLNYLKGDIVVRVGESFNINKNNFKVQEFNVFADYTPETPTHLTFSTEDTRISVTESGKVEGSEEGFAKVKVTDTDNNVETYITVKIVNDKNMEVEFGDKFTVGLTTYGQVWTWGSNTYGELGLGTNIVNADEPKKVTTLTNIVDIGAGLYHAVALAENGDVYTWGLNHAGQLGNESTTNSNIPVKVSGLSNIVKVDAYKHTTLALSQSGDLYIWGEGYSNKPHKVTGGVLDVSGDAIITSDRLVRRINDNVYATGVVNVVKVSASEDRVLIVQADGKVFEVNTSNEVKEYSIPNAIDASAGNGYGYFLTKAKELYTYGSALNGEIGNGTNTAVATPTKLSLTNIEKISAGEGKSGGVADFEGYMFTTGQCDYGQLGHSDLESTNEFKIILNVGIHSNVDKIVKGIRETEVVDIGLGVNLNLKKDLEEDTESTISIVDDTIATLIKNNNGTYTVVGKTIGRTFLNATVSGEIRGNLETFATNIEVRIVPAGGTTVPSMKSGEDFTVALKADGNIEAWGKNTYGQLGVGNNENYDEPQLLENIEETIVEIAVGDNHVLALTEEGTIYGWGLNNKGQVGDGTNTNHNTYTSVLNLSGNELSKVIRVEAHGDNSFAINEDGEVYAWGKDFGNKARKLEALVNAIDVSTSYYAKADGTVYSYTKNDLNNITISPITIVGKVRSIDEGVNHSVFLTTEGKIFAIGNNDYGQLGNGSTDVSSNEAVAMRKDAGAVIENAVAVEAGDRYSIILTADNEVYTTGLNLNGRLGLPLDTTNVLTPVKVAGISNAMLISAGDDHAVVALQDGSAYSWGKGTLGALGNRQSKDSMTPVMVGPYVVRANEANIVLGKTDSFVIKAKTHYFNIIGENKIPMTIISKNTQVARVATLDDTALTDEEVEQGYSAFKVEGIKEGTVNLILTESKTSSTGILQVEVLPVAGTKISPMVETNADHTITLKTNGTVWTYGNNAYGQLGIGTTTNEDEPKQVNFSDGGEDPIIIKQVVSGEFHSAALDTEGNVWTWGRNNYYQLGTSAYSYSSSPIKVSGIPKIKKIASGNNSIIAVTENNKLVVWGQNAYGELGTGTYTNKILPTHVNGMHDVLDIQGGKNHYLILKTTGELYTIGSNLYGQLGIDLGERTRTGTFERIEINPKFGFISAEQGSNVAITVDGAPYIWGQNNFGNLGGSQTKIEQPTQIQGLTGIVEADVGKTNTILRNYNNDIYIVGQNKYGQIGDGTTNTALTYSVSSAIDDILRVATGNTYTVVMKKDGTVWAWGDYNHGNKTLKSRTNSKVPVQIGSDTSSLDQLEIIVKKSEIASILANSEFMFNLIYEDENSTSNFIYESLNTAIATVNDEGNILGIREGTTWVKVKDTETGKVSVAIVKVIDNVEGYNIYTAPKIRTGENFVATLKEDGNIDLWGYDISQMVDSDLPYTINVVETYKDIAAGKNHLVVLRNNGTVWTVGDNSYGQLGIGSNVTNTKLVQIQGLTDIEKIASGDNFCVAMDSYGILYAWGEGYGKSPVVIDTNIRSASYLSAGARDQIVLVLPSGEVYGFGSILNGLLDGIENAVKVEVGDDYLLILDTNGNVYIYRNNTLARESTISRAVDISVAGNTKMYQNVNEKAYVWGDNTYGQLGLDNTNSSNIAVQPINNSDNVFTIGAGAKNTYLVDINGFVYSAGDNSLGQIGNGTKEETTASSYGKSLTHTIVGGRDFEVEPVEAIMEVNDIEELKIKGNTYNVFERQKEKLASEFNFTSTDSTIVSVLEEEGQPTGEIKAMADGKTTVDITDKVTNETKTITRKVVPLDQNRIKIITADGNEATATTPSDETTYVFGYTVDVPMDDDQELVSLSIITKDNTDSISIEKDGDDNKIFVTGGRLDKQITFTGDTMVIPVTVKTANGTEFMYELTLNRVSNNNEIDTVKVNGFEAAKSEAEEDVYEIVVTDIGENEVKVTANSNNAKVSINGQIASTHEQTYTAVLRDGYLEVPFKVTSESGKLRNAWVRIYTEDKLLSLKTLTVNNNFAEKQEDGTYKAIIADDVSRSKIHAIASSEDAKVGINDSEKQTKETTKTVITTLDETTAKIKLEKQAIVDGVEKTITKEYDLNIYKNKVFTMVQEVEVNGEVLEEENNTYKAYVLSNVDTANIVITAKDVSYTIKLDSDEGTGSLGTSKSLQSEVNTYTFTVENGDGDKKEYTIIVERGSTDTKINKITVGDGDYVVQAAATEDTIGDVPVYEARILEAHDNVDVTVITANKTSKVDVNNTGNLRVRIAVENMDLINKTTLVPILVKTADEATSKDYYLRIIKVSDDATLEKAYVDELLSNPYINATVDPNDNTHYEIQLENPVNKVELTAKATNANAEIQIGEEEVQTQTVTTEIDIVSSITDVEVKVTSEAGTEKIYTITIYTISDDTSLESVTVNRNQAVWNKSKNRYEIKVDKDLLGYEVIATATNENAKVKIEGTEAVHTVTKQVTNESDEEEGINETVVDINITAANGITSEMKKLAIIEKSSNKELGYVKVNGKAIAKDDNGDYNVEVVSSVKSVLIEVGAQDANATVNLDGDEMTGVWKNSKVLVTDNEVYDVYIVAEDGRTAGNTFHIKVKRLDGNVNIDTMEVTYTKGGTDTTKAPEQIDENTYYLKIPKTDEERVALRVILEQEISKINVLGSVDTGEIYGYVNLTGDTTTVPIVITAQDGTRRDVTLIIEKESSDTSIRLFQGKHGSSTYIPGTTPIGYTLSIDSKVDILKIKAIPTNENAKIKVVGDSEYVDTLDDREIDVTGINEFQVEVIAEDGETTKQYTIKIYKTYNCGIRQATLEDNELTLHYDRIGELENVIEVAGNTAQLMVKAVNDDAEIYIKKDGADIAADVGTITTNIELEEETFTTYTVVIRGPGEYSNTSSTRTLTVRKKSTNTDATIKLDNEDMTYNSVSDQYEGVVVGGSHTLDVIAGSTYSTVEIEALERTTMPFFISPGVTKVYTVKVTSETGTEKTYKVQIYRKNNDTSIKDVKLKLTSDGDEETLTALEDGSYYKKISRHQASVFVTLTAKDSNATADINGTNNTTTVTAEVAIGENEETKIVPLKIIAEDGTENTVNLKLEKESNDATLKELKYKGLVVQKQANDEYQIEVDNRLTEIKIDAKPTNANAKLKIVGNDTYLSTLTGENVDIDDLEYFEIEVLAEDGETTKTYKVNIRRIFNTEIDEVKVDTTEEVKNVLTDYTAFVSPTAENHTVQVKPANELAVVTFYDNEDNVLKTGTGTVTLLDSFEGESKTYKVKVQGPTGFEEFVTEYTVTLTKRSQDTTASIYINNTLVAKDEDTGKYTYITKVSNNSVKVETTSQYATVSIDDKETKKHEATEIYVVDVGQTKQIKAVVTSQNGESEEYNIEIIRLDNNTNITNITVNGANAIKVTNELYRNAQDKYVREAVIKITPEYELASVKAECDDNIYTASGELEFTVYLSGTGTKEIAITVTAQDGTKKDYTLNIVQNISENMNFNVKVNNVEADKIDSSSYKIFVENASASANVHIYADDEFTTITSGAYSGNDITFDKVLNIDNDITLVTFTVANELGNTNDYMLYIIKESNDYSIKKLYVNGVELTKGDNGRYTTYIENTAGDPTVKVRTNSEYAYVRIGTNDRELQESEKVVHLSENRTTTVPIKTYSQSGIENTEYLDIITTFAVGRIDTIIIDDVEVTEYDEATKTYTALVESSLAEHEILVVADNNYVTLELEGYVGVGSVTSIVSFEENQEIKEMTLFITGETDLTEEYTIIIAQKSNNVELAQVKVNDVTLEQQSNYIYRKNIDLAAKKVKVEVTAKYPYATVKVGDHETMTGATGSLWIDIEVTQDEITIPVVVTAADGHTLQTYNIILTRKASTITGNIITDNYDDKHVANIYVYRTLDLRDIDDPDDPRELVYSTVSNEDGSYVLETPYADKYDIVIKKTSYLTYTITDVQAEAYSNVNVQTVKIKAGDIDETGEIELDDLVEFNDHIGELVDESNMLYDLNEDGLINIEDRKLIKANYHSKTQTVKWRNPNAMGLIAPLAEGYTISSEYGYRVDPIDGSTSFHSGVDLLGPHHGNVYAVADGVVTYAGVQSSYGNCVEIRHIVNGETIYSFYAHLSRIDVELGDLVEQGDIIGLEGGDQVLDPNPGRTTGHHLHFEIRNSSGWTNHVDPHDYLEL